MLRRCRFPCRSGFSRDAFRESVKEDLINQLFARHSCEALFNSRRAGQAGSALQQTNVWSSSAFTLNDLTALDPSFRWDDEKNQTFLKDQKHRG